MIIALLFDVDGVLVNEEKKYFSYHLENEFGISRSKTNEFFEHEFLDCLEGKKDLKEVFPKYLEAWGWQGTVDEALHYWHTKEHIFNEPLVQELENYKKKELKLYIATNQEKYRAAYITNEMGFGKIMDRIFYSGALGHQKPAREYFVKIITELKDLKPEEFLFWDDHEENIVAARGVGMQAEHYRNFAEFQKIMEEQYNLT